MEVKTQRFEMRLDSNLLDRVDFWSDKQDDVPSRAEAVRRLIELGLATTPNSTINFSNSEKLIVALLCELHKGLNVKGELDPDFIQSIIHGGHYWALKWKYGGIFHGYSDDEKTLSEVADILDMWYFIESAHKKLSVKDKEYVKVNARPFGDNVSFPGFDGNNEHKHLSIARFLVEEMGRFSELKGRADLNSHYHTLGIYRRMLEVFIPIRKKLTDRDLNAQELVEILNARIHPENR